MVYRLALKGMVQVPKGPPPAWSRRDCRFDHLVVAAMNQGFGKTLVYSGIESEERAHDVRRGIYRCGRHRGFSADAGPSVLVSGDEMGVRKMPDGTYTLKFRIWEKSNGRAHLIKTRGTDRQQWPYNPRRPATDEERAGWASKDEQGRIVT